MAKDWLVSMEVVLEWCQHDKMEVLRQKPVPMPLCPPQILHELTWDWTQACMVRDHQLTVWAMPPPAAMDIQKSRNRYIAPSTCYSYMHTTREIQWRLISFVDAELMSELHRPSFCLIIRGWSDKWWNDTLSLYSYILGMLFKFSVLFTA